MRLTAAGSILPHYWQGFGDLEIQEDAIVWTQRWRAVMSVFGFVPRWAPDTVRIPLADIERVTMECRGLFSPELVVIRAGGTDYVFWVSFAPYVPFASVAGRRFARRLGDALIARGLSTAVEIPRRRPFFRLMGSAVLLVALTWVSVFAGFALAGLPDAAREATVIALASGVVPLWAYS